MPAPIISRLIQGTIKVELPSDAQRLRITQEFLTQNPQVAFVNEQAKNHFIAITKDISIRAMEDIFRFAAQNSLVNAGALSKKISTQNINDARNQRAHTAEEVLNEGDARLTENERLHKESLHQQAETCANQLAVQALAAKGKKRRQAIKALAAENSAISNEALEIIKGAKADEVNKIKKKVKKKNHKRK